MLLKPHKYFVMCCYDKIHEHSMSIPQHFGKLALAVHLLARGLSFACATLNPENIVILLAVSLAYHSHWND